MSRVPRAWSAAGLAVATLGALFITQSGAPVLDLLPGEGLVPAVLVLLGAAVAAYGLLRSNPGPAVGGAALLVVGAGLVRLGLPSALEWVAAVGGAAGLVLFLEPLLVADRARELRDRLEEAGSRRTGADPDALAERTVALRMSQVRKSLLLAAGLVAAGLGAGVLLRAILPGALAASLELDSLYGAVLWVGLAIAVAVAYQVLQDRGAGDDADEADEA